MRVRKVKILGAVYKVQYKSRDQIAKDVGFPAYGYCENGKKLIVIDKSLGDKDRIQTLKHEMGHAVMHRVGLDQVLSAEIQEIVCESFANVF
jgi:Zn-dependent peptidase ImmA (M78 family)